MPAKLPPERIEPPRRYLRDLQIGEQCEVSFVNMFVDAQGFCYLDRGAKIEDPDSGWSTITVSRDQTGYHVISKWRWSPHTFRRKPGFWVLRRYYPVESYKEV
jgi:hypothetical protein